MYIKWLLIPEIKKYFILCIKIFKLKVKYLYNRLKWKNHSVHAYTNIMLLSNKRLITIYTQRSVFPIFIPVYICKWCQICTHTHVNVLFRGVIYVGLRGEGRRKWEGMEWIWIIWLHWNHLNLIFVYKYFTCNLNILLCMLIVF